MTGSGETPAAYVPALRRYFARRAHTDDVDDLVQEVLLRMQAAPDLLVIEHLDRYLFRVASSVLTDSVRRGAVRRDLLHDSLEESHHPVEERGPERVLMDQEALDRTVAAIERLPTRVRDIFVMHRFEEMTCGSIAAQLNLSVSSVEKDLMKAMVALRSGLEAP